MSCLVYLSDPKYNANGLYEIDPTWGRINRTDGTYDYQETLKNYSHFARPLQEAIKIKERSNLEYYNNRLTISILMGRLKRLNDLFKYQAPPFIIADCLKLILDACKEISSMYKNDFMTEEIRDLDKYITECRASRVVDKDKIGNILSRIKFKLLNSSFDSLWDALYRVKLIEHSIDKNKFPLSDKVLKDACYSRLGILSYFHGGFNAGLTEEHRREIILAELAALLHGIAGDGVPEISTLPSDSTKEK